MKNILFIFFFFLAGSFLLAPAVLATGIPEPQISVEIGSFKGFNEGEGWTESGGNLEVDWIGQYIGAIYNYGVAVAGVLAVIMIMVGGFLWLVSAGNPNQISTAKDFITSALTGLLLALFSFIILQTVNPRLVKLEGITVSQIQPINTVGGTDSSSGIAITPERDGTGSDGDYWTGGNPVEYTQRNEGYNPCAYRDSLGNLTIGYGHLVTGADNINEGDCISSERANELFEDDYQDAIDDAVGFVGGEANWNQLDADRRTVLVDMAFNLGGGGLDSFVNLQAAVVNGIETGDATYWVTAGAEIVDSIYAGQVPNRARRNSEIMISGAMDALLH
ncbi:MAG: hypothetical protein HUU49_02970 [Candidatus Buchananbacteria bacterium]|nr:hypothetical protein [Candidatus Buchananbacteria bacterium]